MATTTPAPAPAPSDLPGKPEDETDSRNARQAIAGPLVFSCGKCRTIIGDSLSLVGTHAQLKTITLAAASKITRTEELVTSKVGLDKGSTFVNLNCFNCSALLGRYYLTTPKGLDELREKFSFLIENISSYELGKYEYGEAVDAPNPTLEESRVESQQKPSLELEENILKIQHVVLGLENRLSRVEELCTLQYANKTLSHSAAEDSQDDEDGPQRKKGRK